MELRKFLSALRILRSIDRDELEAVGAIQRGDNVQWNHFLLHPFEWFIWAEDDRAQAAWGIVERRLSMKTSESEKDRLNRMAVEEVMGWEEGYEKFTWVNDNADEHPWWCKNNKLIMRQSAWNPYENPAHWEMVINEMRKRSMWLTLKQISSKEAPWRARFEFGGMVVGGRRQGEAEADTIGKAILLAMEKVIKEEGQVDG